MIQVDNLKPWVYTVTETEYDKYIPQQKEKEYLYRETNALFYEQE